MDTTLFLKKDDQNLLVVQIYVDDIIFGATKQSLCEEFAKLMQGEFEMSMMGELTFFLGLQIKQEEEEMFINQTKYIREIIKKFGTSLRSAGTPMSNKYKLDNNDGGKSIDQKLYRGMIGSLLYLIASRLDILFSIYMCVWFQFDPRESHYLATREYLNI